MSGIVDAYVDGSARDVGVHAVAAEPGGRSGRDEPSQRQLRRGFRRLLRLPRPAGEVARVGRLRRSRAGRGEVSGRLVRAGQTGRRRHRRRGRHRWRHRRGARPCRSLRRHRGSAGDRRRRRADAAPNRDDRRSDRGGGRRGSGVLGVGDRPSRGPRALRPARRRVRPGRRRGERGRDHQALDLRQRAPAEDWPKRARGAPRRLSEHPRGGAADHGRAGRGAILGVTSGSGWRAADAGAYSCAKRAVAALTWQLGRVAPPGVVVNAMSPIAATRMVAAASGAGPRPWSRRGHRRAVARLDAVARSAGTDRRPPGQSSADRAARSSSSAVPRWP